MQKKFKFTNCGIITPFALIILLVFCIEPSSLISAESKIEMEKQELNKLRTAINEQIERIQKKPYNQMQYLKEFTEIEFAIALRRKNMHLSQLMLDTLEKEIHDVQVEIGNLKMTKQVKQEYYKKRIRDLYKVSRQPLLSTLRNKESLEEIYFQIEYLQMLVKRDQKYVKNYEKLVKFWVTKKNTFEKLKMDAVSSRQELWPQKEGLEKDVKRRTDFMTSLKENPDKYQQFLDEIKKANEMLHSQVAESNCYAEESGLEEIVAKKSLPLPIDINLLKTKKKYWNKDRLHPITGGIEFFIPENSEINAVAAGTVCFSDWFIGFGNTIIIDHGNKWFSVYSYCSALHVEKGDHVDTGQLIAFVGDSSSLRGFALYFELIRDNIPVAPLDAFGLKF